MDTLPERRAYVLQPVPHAVAEIGLWLGGLEDARRRTKRRLFGLPPAALDWLAEPEANSIGTVLAHLVDAELGWLYNEVLEQPMPREIQALALPATYDEHGRLTQCSGLSLESHLARLDAARDVLLAAYRGLTMDQFRRLHRFPDHDMTPEGVLLHLIQHESEHRSELVGIRARAELARGLA